MGKTPEITAANTAGKVASYSIKDGMITVCLPFDATGRDSKPSADGKPSKSLIHASTGGFREIGFALDGHAIKVSCNVITSK
jgi:hypothetical protein